MGGDIAAWCAQRGFTVTLQDRSEELIRPALERARAAFEKRSRVPGQAEETMRRLSADVPGSGIERADVVIEAIYENLEAKRALYAAIEPRLKPGAVLATNTSSLMLEPLSPADRRKLLESIETVLAWVQGDYRAEVRKRFPEA